MKVVVFKKIYHFCSMHFFIDPIFFEKNEIIGKILLKNVITQRYRYIPPFT